MPLNSLYFRMTMLVWLSLGAIRAGAQTPAGSPARGAPGRLVDVGGYKLHIDCHGSGSPTVVLIHGFNDYSFVWDRVAPAVAQLTRVCAYDRAGQAWSDPGPKPRGLSRITDELHALLERAGERPPFVLVGHSWGGLIPRVYVDRYARQIAGAVLVDASDEMDYLSVRDTTVRPAQVQDSIWARLWPQPRPDTGGKPASFMPRALAKTPAPFDLLSAEDQKTFMWARAQPVYFENGDWADVRDDLRLVQDLRKRSAYPFASRPLIVLSAMVRGDADEAGVSAVEQRRAWEQGQRDLAAQSRNARWIPADASGHDIHLVEPDLVVDAIRQVVHAARSSASLCCRSLR